MKFIKFSSIEQYRRTVKEITFSSAYAGQDSNDEPIYDMTKDKPTIDFVGTVKLHGTNAGVGYDGTNIWAQKRGGICTLEKDNMGFAAFVEANKEAFIKLFNKLWEQSVCSEIVMFGEWCGSNIQKGVGICELDKMFVIFDVKMIDRDGVEGYRYDEHHIIELQNIENKIFNIYQFPHFKLEIDFNKPELVQDRLIEITNQVEKECPVAKELGVSGVGEGVVWRGVYKDKIYRFKVKGEKHSTSKVKQLAAVDVEKITQCREFVEYAVTPNRLNQAIEQVFTSNGLEPDKRWTGDFIRWVINDIAKEEMDTMVESKLEPKDVNKYVGEATRLWFFKYLGP